MLTREQAHAAADAVLDEPRARQARAAAVRRARTAHPRPAPWAGWALVGLTSGLVYDGMFPGTTHVALAGLAVGTLIGRWRAARAGS